MHFPLPWQLILILLVMLVIFGASKLPEFGKGLGEGGMPQRCACQRFA